MREAPPDYIEVYPYFLRREDRSIVPCANHPGEHAIFLTEYDDTGWQAECDWCHETNLRANE